MRVPEIEHNIQRTTDLLAALSITRAGLAALNKAVDDDGSSDAITLIDDAMTQLRHGTLNGLEIMLSEAGARRAA